MARMKQVARQLSHAMLASAWEPEALALATHVTTGSQADWHRELARQIHQNFPPDSLPPPEELTRYILASDIFDDAWRNLGERPELHAYTLAAPETRPPARCFHGLELPQFANKRALADYFELTVGELDWMADAQNRLARARTPPRTQHYIYQWREKPYGPPRLIEAPKPRLKALQRKLLREILDPLPVHEAAFGFRKGHSCVDNARKHCGRAVLMRLDLKDFFPSIRAARIHALFTQLGYGSAIARVLTGLVTHKTPKTVFARFQRLPPAQQPGQDFLTQPHLPQGAPTSPTLANLAAFRLDCRLSGLARKYDLTYSRYADDLAFSGDRDFARHTKFLHICAAAIALEEGFLVNTRKTRVMHGSQRQKLTGICVNTRPNLPRAAFDRLKATLHNCTGHGPGGPGSQNRAGHPDFRAHLAGRVNWVEQLNPRRGAKLRRLFDQIDWD